MNLIKTINLHGTPISLEDTIRKHIYDTLYPVGFVYTQLPDDPDPYERDNLDSNSSIVWEELHFGGVFFRTEGVNAMPYSPYSEGMVVESYIDNQISFNSIDYDFTHIGELDYGWTYDKKEKKNKIIEITLYNNIVVYNGEIRKITNKTTTDSKTILTLESKFNFTEEHPVVLIGQSDTYQNHIHDVTEMGGQSGSYMHVNFGVSGGEHIRFPWLTTNTNSGNKSFETRPESITIKLWKRVS